MRTLTARSRADLLALAVALGDALVLLADLLGLTAGARDAGGVAEVGVDADDVGADAVDLDVLDDDVTGAAVAGAVAAGAVELADVDVGAAADGDGAAAVVLDDLVLSLLGTAALDEDVAVAEGRDGVYGGVRC